MMMMMMMMMMMEMMMMMMNPVRTDCLGGVVVSYPPRTAVTWVQSPLNPPRLCPRRVRPVTPAGILLVTPLGAWLYRVSPGTVWPGVSLW